MSRSASRRAAAVLLAGLLAAASASGQQEGAPQAPAPQRSACRISGTVASGATRLPGVLITAVPGPASDPLTATTGPDGTFVLAVPGPGEYSVTAEFPAFADVSRSVTLDASCQAAVEFAMVLASRAPRPASAGDAAAAPPITAAQPGATRPVTRPQPPAAAQQAPAAADTDESIAAAAAQLSLPPGFSIDTSGESVAATGAAGQINPNLMFGPPGEGPGGMMGGMPGMGSPVGMPGVAGDGRTPEAGMQGGFGGMGGGMPQFAGGGPGGGPGGMEGGPGGRGGGGGRGSTGGLAGAAGRLQMAGRLQQNRTRVQLTYNLGGSPFNARPYAINGQSPDEPSNLQHRFGVNIGGPLKIPGLFDAGPRTNYFLNYSGSHGRTFRESYSRVPTSAQRAGDLSAMTGTVYDPLTGEPFAGNRIPADRISPAAASLLALYPLPNQDAPGQNYHYATTVTSHSDDVNLRLTRSFGAAPAGRGGMPGGGRGGMMGGPGGRGGGSVNVSAGVQYRRSSGDQTTSFPALGGKNTQTGWNVPASVMFQRWGLFNSVNLQYNRSHAVTSNVFAGVRDVAGEAGIAGVSTDPFAWGAPSLSFTSFTGLRDITPSERTDQTITLGLAQSRMRGRHMLRWGADVRWMRNDSRSDSNPRGSFVFTGLYSQRTKIAGSGNDFADFLLGLPQQASLQYGPGTLRFRSLAWSAFVQDDWRVGANLTINAGVRYEYLSPYREANNHLVNLDVAPGFTAAVPVLAGQAGPFTGVYPDTIVEPDWNNVAPRIGVAWRPKPRLVVRAGYGINYSSPVYQGLARQLAAQPPFAVTDTRIGTLLAPLSLATVFTQPGSDETTNNFGVDREYDLGYLQMWNLGVTRDLTRTLSAGLTYTGTKGGSLDLLRAPNRGPNGLLIDGVQAFTWESSGGRSIMHALTVQLRKRPARGVGGGLTYTWSKAMDNASSLGGGGGGSGVVAQNDKDLEAEWGLSSFDQRHRLQADLNVELPFGPNRRWLNGDGWAAQVLGGWSWNTNVTLAAGTPLTARVIGSTSDVARGVNGTLRADYNGQPIALPDPTIARYFNTGAFSMPAAGAFGNSARNLIIGPGQRTASMSLMKTVQLAQGRSLSLRVQANNVFNTVQFAAIDTTVNSPTFGQVLSVRAMRSVQFNVRLGL